MRTYYPTQFLMRLLIMFLLAIPASFVFAGLTVSPILGSNMVLQRETTVPVFGKPATR